MAIWLPGDPETPPAAAPRPLSGLTYITRSFSYKLPGPPGSYQSTDFFCSQRAECRVEDAEMVSVQVYEFCKRQVLADVQRYKKEENLLRQTSAAAYEVYQGREALGRRQQRTADAVVPPMPKLPAEEAVAVPWKDVAELPPMPTNRPRLKSAREVLNETTVAAVGQVEQDKF